MKLILALACAPCLFGQGAAIDWPFAGNDAQRTGWEKSDSRITKANIKQFQLVMKMSLDPKLKGAHSLTPPVVLGRLISYRGFKELAFVESSSDRLWAIDADMNRVFWEKHFEKPQHVPRTSGPNAALCATAVVSAPSLTPPVTFGSRPRPAASAAPAKPAAPPSAVKSLLSAGGFGGPRPAFAVSSDGKLHILNTSTGEDVGPAISFLPPGAKANSLTVHEGVVYTITRWGCAGSSNGVWAVDLNGEEPKVSHFPGNVTGIALGADGTVYAQTPESITSLTPIELKVKNSFTAPEGLAGTSPVLFTYQGRELAAAAGKTGQLHLFDARTLSLLSSTAPSGKVWGGLSSWQDSDGNRWVLAPVWGPLDPSLKSENRTGSIVAYQLDASTDKPALTPAWISPDLDSPEPPVITSGIVFALSAGNYSTSDLAKPTGHATLFAFDGTTGAQLYSSADQATAPANLTGVTLANGRVFFTTTDGTLYGFGIFLER
jgi:outer membrane protein assembly factor BamB